MAMRLLAVKRQSIESIKRLNRVLKGRRPMDAVLDMDAPFSDVAQQLRAVIGNNLCIPNATNDRVACTAAIGLLQRSKSGDWHPTSEKGRRNPAASVSQNIRRAYSAACLRGGGERAGIVDLGDLVIGEAEHLAQDFVGMLAEQRLADVVCRSFNGLSMRNNGQVCAEVRTKLPLERFMF